jgi:hypothetical protein
VKPCACLAQEPATARERWRALHHAQRHFRRRDQETLFKLSRMRKARVGHAVEERLVQAMERVINPPLVYDPQLPGGGFPRPNPSPYLP